MKNNGNSVATTEPVVVVVPVFDDAADPVVIDFNFDETSGSQFAAPNFPAAIVVLS
jgi:hypothetical protein